MDLSRPGKPTDNALVKSFNGSLRDECLNVHWFLSLEDAQEKIEGWRHRAWRTAMARKSLPRAAGLNIAGFNGGIALGSILGGIALEITGLVSTAWVGAYMGRGVRGSAGNSLDAVSNVGGKKQKSRGAVTSSAKGTAFLMPKEGALPAPTRKD